MENKINRMTKIYMRIVKVYKQNHTRVVQCFIVDNDRLYDVSRTIALLTKNRACKDGVGIAGRGFSVYDELLREIRHYLKRDNIEREIF